MQFPLRPEDTKPRFLGAPLEPPRISIYTVAGRQECLGMKNCQQWQGTEQKACAPWLAKSRHRIKTETTATPIPQG